MNTPILDGDLSDVNKNYHEDDINMLSSASGSESESASEYDTETPVRPRKSKQIRRKIPQTHLDEEESESCSDATTTATELDIYRPKDDRLFIDEITEGNAKDIYIRMISGFKSCTVKLSKRALYQMLTFLAKIFLNRNIPREQFGAWAWTLLELDRNDGNLTYTNIDEALQRKIWGLQNVMSQFLDNDISMSAHKDFPDIGNPMHMFSKLHEVLIMCHSFIFSEWRVRSIWGQNTDVHVPRYVELFRFSFRELSGLTDFQNLLMFLLDRLRRFGYRKKGSDCYKEITVIYDNCRYGTHSWIKQQEIENFIYTNVTKETSFEQWCNMTSAGDTVKRATNYLKQSDDSEFPTLQTCRYLQAFQNGLYHTWSNTFVPWDKSIEDIKDPDFEALRTKFRELDPEVINDLQRTRLLKDLDEYEKDHKMMKNDMKTKDACKFTNQCVDPNWVESHKRTYNPETRRFTYASLDWVNIPTPAFTQILTHQKLGYKEDKTYEENKKQAMLVEIWFLAAMGRLLYDLGDKDEWQILPYIRGLAGTGKSSIGRAVKNFFLPEDVAQLSNNIEKKFGLQGIYDKKMWICFEAKDDFGLTQTDFQSMVSGEPMSIAVKHKDPVQTTWTPPGLMLGNVLPPWVNAQGSISRRVLLIDFIEGISGGDPTLPKQLAEQCVALLVKANLAYLWATSNFGHRLIWENLPIYFHEKQAQMEMETDSLFYFVMANEVLERDPGFDSTRGSIHLQTHDAIDDYRMSMRTFETLYQRWCMENRRKTVNMADKNNLRHTLRRAGLSMRFEIHKLGGFDLPEQWIIGIRRRAMTAYALENIHSSAISAAITNARAPPPIQN